MGADPRQTPKPAETEGDGLNIHEYQGKEILKKHGVSTPRGIKVTCNPADMGRLLKSVL